MPKEEETKCRWNTEIRVDSASRVNRRLREVTFRLVLKPE